MYQAFDLKKLLGFFLSLAALVTLVRAFITPPDDVWEFLRLVTTSSTFTLLLIVGAGESPIFKWIWRKLASKQWCFPYIHGKWEGTISSNWSVIEAAQVAATSRTQLNSGDLNVSTTGGLLKKVNVEIKATLLNVSMKLIPQDDYSESQTIFLKPVMLGENGRPRLFYMFKTTVRIPKASDSQIHYGAAWLDVYVSSLNLELKGIYFTDREWTKGFNTAGEMKISQLP